MENNDKDSRIAKLIKSRLAEQIGVEVEDIKDEDSFTEDLHMSPADFADFISGLETVGIDATGLELTTNQTVAELIEEVKAQIIE
jgi:acyl carrier protein